MSRSLKNIVIAFVLAIIYAFCGKLDFLKIFFVFPESVKGFGEKLFSSVFSGGSTLIQIITAISGYFFMILFFILFVSIANGRNSKSFTGAIGLLSVLFICIFGRYIFSDIIIYIPELYVVFFLCLVIIIFLLDRADFYYYFVNISLISLISVIIYDSFILNLIYPSLRALNLFSGSQAEIKYDNIGRLQQITGISSLLWTLFFMCLCIFILIVFSKDRRKR